MLKCSAQQKSLLRRLIISDLLDGVATKEAKSEEFDMDQYIKDFYNEFKSQIPDPILLLDMTRLLPTLFMQVLTADRTLGRAYYNKGLTLGQLEALDIKYENVKELRSDLGLNIRPPHSQVKTTTIVPTDPRPIVTEDKLPDIEAYDSDDVALRSRLHHAFKKGKEKEKGNIYNATCGTIAGGLSPPLATLITL